MQEARKRNQRAEGVVASAAHLLPRYDERGGGRHSDQPFFLQLRVLPHMGSVYIRIIYDAFPFCFLDLCTYGGRDGMGYSNGNEKVTSCEGDHNGSGMKSSSASTL